MTGVGLIVLCDSAAPIKRTAVERQVNVQIVFLFIFLLALSLGSTVGSSIRTVCLISRFAYLTNSRLMLALIVVLLVEPMVPSDI